MSPTIRNSVLAVLGAILWFIAALFIRFTMPLGWFEGNNETIILFVVSVPLAMIAIELIQKITQGEAGSMIRTASVISVVGLLLDALALSWSRDLYSKDPVGLETAAAWLLWVVGFTLAYSLMRDSKK